MAYLSKLTHKPFTYYNKYDYKKLFFQFEKEI